MQLNLIEKLSAEEIIEIRKRVFSFAEQMFMQGISVGRELNRAEFEYPTETFVRDKISAMTSYFIRDDVWEAMPPHGYNPDPQVDIPEPPVEKIEELDNLVNMIHTGSEEYINSTLGMQKESVEGEGRPLNQ